MPKQVVTVGATSRTEYVRVTDMNGSPITGLVFNSSGLLSKYVLASATSSAITLVTQTVTGAYSSGGLVEVDATAFPGVYRFDIPNAAFASGNKSFVSLYGFSGMDSCILEYELTAFDLQTAAVTLASSQTFNNTGTWTGPLTGSVGSVTAGVTITAGQLAAKKNTALSGFTFPMYNTSGSPTTGLTVAATRSLNGAAFGSCSNSVTEISNGWYTIDLSAGDMNGNTVALRFAATGAVDTDITILTQA